MFPSPLFHAGCKPEQQMMYAGSKNRLVQTAELTKVWAWGRGSQSVREEGQGVGLLVLRKEGAEVLPLSVPEWIIISRTLPAQVFEIRTTDDLTEAWLQEKLSFFR